MTFFFRKENIFNDVVFLEKEIFLMAFFYKRKFF